jgi:hypothetical protein
VEQRSKEGKVISGKSEVEKREDVGGKEEEA